MDIYPARLIKSIAGRDKNKYFAVMEVIDENYILISDGKGRTTEKPKRKKIKHITDMECELLRIKEKMNEAKKISNSDIRKAIKTALADLGINEFDEDKES